jgi:HD superfamily phosphohydrolase
MPYPRTTELRKKPPRDGSGLYYDPLYGFTPFLPKIRKVMDLDVFQRLRGLKQLSTVYLVFAGAIHTRFEHSVGVAHLAGIVHERLRELSQADGSYPKLNAITQASVQLAALFHDIGHGPFGHLFEFYCRREPNYHDWDHEKTGLRLMKGDGPEPIYQQIPEFLKNLTAEISPQNDGRPELIKLLLPQNLYNLAVGDPPDLGDAELNTSYDFLKDIISSAYGVDRLDYLRRDAYFSGVNTGNVDVWEIISNLRIRKYQGKSSLFLERSVAAGLEALLNARASVFRRLYHNPIHRSAQELIIRGLQELKTSPEDLVFLTDGELLDLFRERGNKGNLFSREVYERIKFRVLYEVIPIVSRAEITAYKTTLDRYTRGGQWATLTDRENFIAYNAGVLGNGKIFYDLERVPVIKSEDYSARIFWDPVSQSPSSLFDLQPHLFELFGGENYGTGVGKAETFIDHISSIYLAFPFEHLADEVKKAAATEPPAEWPRIASEIYNKKLKGMVTGFFTEVLEEPQLAQRPKLVQFLERIGREAEAYILGLISLFGSPLNQ